MTWPVACVLMVALIVAGFTVDNILCSNDNVYGRGYSSGYSDGYHRKAVDKKEGR